MSRSADTIARRTVSLRLESARPLDESLSAGSQLGDPDAQTIGQPDDVRPAWVTAAVLNVADPALPKAGGLGELHLADTPLSAGGMNSPPQGGDIGR